MALNENLELLEAVEPAVATLIAEHQERRKDWYFHDLIPWERGRNFVEVPWDESQCTINERARTSLVLNLLTEDNLPWYHLALERHLPKESVWKEWNGLWTAEEGQHAIAIRSYLLTSRNCDPYELEDQRMATMKKGWEPNWADPAELFAYTSAQELATRVSHRNAGRITEDEAAFDLMRNIATDENHHFVFYRGVMAAMLEQAPSVAIEGIYNTFVNFEMPGVGIPGFLRKSIEVARAGVYNLRIHHDNVVQPLIAQWGLERLEGLTTRAAEIQEKLMALPAQILRNAERFEARFAM
jgi:acyl-[acyl-carrier-protein] desaturase